MQFECFFLRLGTSLPVSGGMCHTHSRSFGGEYTSYRVLLEEELSSTARQVPRGGGALHLIACPSRLSEGTGEEAVNQSSGGAQPVVRGKEVARGIVSVWPNGLK